MISILLSGITPARVSRLEYRAIGNKNDECCSIKMFVSTFRCVDHLASPESKFSPHQQESSERRNTLQSWGLCSGGPETEQFVNKTVGTLTTDTKCLYSPPVLRLFSFNATCQFTPLLNLRSLVSCLKPYGSLRSVTVTPYLSWKHNFQFAHFLTQILCQMKQAWQYLLYLPGVPTAFICLMSNTAG